MIGYNEGYHSGYNSAIAKAAFTLREDAAAFQEGSLYREVLMAAAKEIVTLMRHNPAKEINLATKQSSCTITNSDS